MIYLLRVLVDGDEHPPAIVTAWRTSNGQWGHPDI